MFLSTSISDSRCKDKAIYLHDMLSHGYLYVKSYFYFLGSAMVNSEYLSFSLLTAIFPPCALTTCKT